MFPKEDNLWSHNIFMKFFFLLLAKIKQVTIHKTVIALKDFPEGQYLKADTQQTGLVCLYSWFSGNWELIQCSELYVSLCKHTVLLNISTHTFSTEQKWENNFKKKISKCRNKHSCHKVLLMWLKKLASFLTF